MLNRWLTPSTVPKGEQPKQSAPQQEYIPRSNTKMTLDELYNEGRRFGEVCIGMTFNPQGCEIKMNSDLVKGDFIYVKSKRHDNPRDNLAECIQRASLIVQFYKQMG